MNRKGRRISSALAALAASFWLVTGARCAVDLRWQPADRTATVGEEILLDLFAYSDSAAGQLISALDAAIAWDTTYLQFVTLADPEPIFDPSQGGGFDGFFDQPSGINQSLTDGDMLYTAFAALGEPILVPATGIRLARFQFQALAPAPLTRVSILSAIGNDATRVFDGVEPNLDVTGVLGSARVTVLPEPCGLLCLAAGLVGVARRLNPASRS